MSHVRPTSIFSLIALCCILFSSQFSVMAQESTDSENNEDILVRYTRVDPDLFTSKSKSDTLNWNSFGPGVSAGDFDNDGDMDVYVSARFSYLEWEDSQNSHISLNATFKWNINFLYYFNYSVAYSYSYLTTNRICNFVDTFTILNKYKI